MRKNADLILLGILICLCILSWALKSDYVIIFTLFIAFMGFPTVLKFPLLGVPDERESFIHQKSSTITFSAIISLLFISILLYDTQLFLKSLGVKTMLEMILVLIYLLYLGAYVIFKRIY